MSLFKARDWWSTTLGEKEEFDQGCLCVADVDNSGIGQGKHILSWHSSLTGDLQLQFSFMLSVYTECSLIKEEKIYFFCLFLSAFEVIQFHWL